MIINTKGPPLNLKSAFQANDANKKRPAGLEETDEAIIAIGVERPSRPPAVI